MKITVEQTIKREIEVEFPMYVKDDFKDIYLNICKIESPDNGVEIYISRDGSFSKMKMTETSLQKALIEMKPATEEEYQKAVETLAARTHLFLSENLIVKSEAA